MSHTDTDPRARQILSRGFRRLSGERRLAMALEMSEECRDLARIGLRTRAPGISAEEVEQRVARAYVGEGLLVRIQNRPRRT